MVAANVKEDVALGRLLLGGTRNHVLYLAQHHPRPKGDVDTKRGLWSPQRHFYGNFNPTLWATSTKHWAP